MRNDSAVSAGPSQYPAKRDVTEDATQISIEKDLYDLLAVCLKMLELEKRRKDLSGRSELRELDGQMAAMMKDKEIFVGKIESETRKRLRCPERARP